MIPRYLANPTVTELALTSEQKDWPRYNKAAAVVSMDPALFLGLTTVGTEHEAEVAAEAHTLEDYNRYGSIVHPFLVVDRKTGEVMSHEGRHRAAAVQVAGGGDFPVAVILYPARRADTWEDVPAVLVSEYFRKYARRRRYDLRDEQVTVTSQAPQS